MNIIDHTAQRTSEDLNTYVGNIVRCANSYYLVIDLEGQYGWVNMATGHAVVPDEVEDLIYFIEHSTLMPTTTLMIGDPQ
jgi:hypothetical protein